LAKSARAGDHGLCTAHIVDRLPRILHRRQRIEVSGIAVIPAEIFLVDRLGVVAQRSVIAAHGPFPSQARGQAQFLGDLGRRKAFVHKAQRSIVDEFVEVALFLQQVDHARLARDRPVMLRDHDFGPVAEGFQRFVDVARPEITVPHLRTADGVEIMHGVGDVFRHVEQAELREVQQHLRRRLRPRHELEGDFDAVDHARLQVLLDGGGRRDQRDPPERDRLAQSGIDLAARARGQEDAELILRAPAHRGAGRNAVADQRVHEARRREDLDLAGRDLVLAGHALDPAKMIAVVMGVDDGADGFPRPVLVIEIERGARGFGGGQRVDDDQRAVALDDGHVGDVEAAHLVDAVGDLEKAVDGIELRLPPQARVDAVGRRFLLQELVGLHVPGGPRTGARDQRVGQGADEAAHRVVGGRSARVHESVLKSVFELIAEGRIESFSVAEVAARAGVHETSIYRRWPSRDLLIDDACRHYIQDSIPIPDTGSLRGDLIALIRHARNMLTSRLGQVIVALTLLQNEPARAARHDHWKRRFERLRVIFDRAVARGEFPRDADPVAVLQTLIAPLYFRLLVTVEKLEDWPVTEEVDRLLHGYAKPVGKKMKR
jgi:AcrR family transcriptional regulator